MASGVPVDAEGIARGLGARSVGDRQWMACCPAHDDKTPSLSISAGADGRALVHCHAGCGQDAVIAALVARGLWQGAAAGDRPKVRRRRRAGPAVAPPVEDLAPVEPDARRVENALAIWRVSVPAEGTPVEWYLRSRGIRMPIPARLRCHPALPHRTDEGVVTVWPAMVALVQRARDGEALGVHRTYLLPDGSGKAPVERAKKMLAAVRGGVVRLGNVGGGPLVLGEGIETTLSVMQATGWPGWAALSTANLKAIELPEGVGDVLICADGDCPGVAAAIGLAVKEWSRGPRRVGTMAPPGKADWNDILRRRLS